MFEKSLMVDQIFPNPPISPLKKGTSLPNIRIMTEFDFICFWLYFLSEMLRTTIATNTPGINTFNYLTVFRFLKTPYYILSLRLCFLASLHERKG